MLSGWHAGHRAGSDRRLCCPDGADELMLVSSIFDPEQRLKSYELGAVAMQNLAQANTPRRAMG